NDVLYGLGGNDVLQGGGGADASSAAPAKRDRSKKIDRRRKRDDHNSHPQLTCPVFRLSFRSECILFKYEQNPKNRLWHLVVPGAVRGERMEKVTLGATGLEVSRISLGTWAFGGDPVWGEQGDRESIDTVSAALACGVNFIDTAAGYAEGRSEEVLGRALAGRRDRAVIATKAYGTLDRAGVIAACEASLKRLATDYIDVYYVHWPNPAIPLAETVATLGRLLDAGKIRVAGVSNFGPLTLADLAATGNH